MTVFLYVADAAIEAEVLRAALSGALAARDLPCAVTLTGQPDAQAGFVLHWKIAPVGPRGFAGQMLWRAPGGTEQSGPDMQFRVVDTKPGAQQLRQFAEALLRADPALTAALSALAQEGAGCENP